MDSERVLILGGSGLIGTALSEILRNNYTVFTTYHKKIAGSQSIRMDILDPESVANAFSISNPNVTINLCAIFNNVDFCEQNKEIVMAINGSSLGIISKLSNKFRSHLIQMSTDYVFDGKSGNYKEDDQVNPVNYYGITKVKAENNVKHMAERYCIVRSSLVYGNNVVKQTLPDWIIDGISKQGNIRLISDQYTTPTYLENLCSMLAEIIKIKYQGIIHLAGPERLSRYDFAKKLLHIMGSGNDKIIPVSHNEFDFGKKMPLDSSLNTDKARSMLSEKPESVERSITRYLEKRNVN